MSAHAAGPPPAGLPAPRDNGLAHALRHLSGAALAHDVAAFAVVWVAVLGLGLLAYRLLRPGDLDPLAEVTVTLALGITAYGAVLFALGFLPVLHQLPLALISLACAAPLLWCGRRGAQLAGCVWARWRASLRGEWVVVGPATAMVALAFLAGFRPPFAADELAYHWPAPLLWAHAGHWVTSPYRFTNGFSLAEMLYTPAAAFGAATAAHWTDAVTLVVLALGTAALARRFGGLGALAAAAVIAVPTATDEAWFAYDDIFAASLALAACVVVARRTGWRARLTSGILLAGAVSVKPVMVLMAPLAVILALMAERRAAGRWQWGTQVRHLVPMVAPGLVAVAAWIGYSLEFVGRAFQRNGFVVAVFGHDHSHGLATARIPTLWQALAIPFLPLATAVIGQDEPYGGRSSLVLAVFIPVLIVTAVKMDRDTRRRLGALAVPVLLTYLVAAVLLVRTRYLLVVYCGGLAAATVAVAWWDQHSPRAWGDVVHWAFRLLVLVGLLDVVRHTVSG